MKWLGENSFLIYLIEGKLIAIWLRFSVLRDKPLLYLLTYTAATVAGIYIYRYGSQLLSRISSFFDKLATDGKIQKN